MPGTELTSAKRQSILQDMAPGLREEVKHLAAIQAKIAQGNLKLTHRFGERIGRIIAREDEFGAQAVPRVAEYFGMQTQQLYNLRKLATTWSRDEISALCERRMPDDGCITVSHLLAIQTLESQAERTKKIDKVFKQGISFKELSQEIPMLGAAGRRHSPGLGKSGRHPTRPRHLMAGVQQVRTSIQAINNKFGGWDEVVFQPICDVPVDKVDEKSIEALELTIAQIDDALPKLQAARKRCSAGLTRMQRIYKPPTEDTAGDDSKPSKGSKKKTTTKKKKSSKGKTTVKA